MKAPGPGMQICEERDLLGGPESLTASPFTDCGALALHQIPCGEGSFPPTREACQVEPLELPMVRSEKSHIGF